MPNRKGKRYDYTYEEYLEIKRINKEKLDKIFATPNYQEVYGRKWYGDNWKATLWGNHPEREAQRKLNSERAYKRSKGEYVEDYVTWKEKPITQLDMEGNVIKVWNSAMEWGKENNKEISQINQVVKTARDDAKASAYGYRWRFDDLEEIKKGNE